MILARTTESPKYNRAYLEARYPEYTILGDRSGWFYPVTQTRVVFVSVGWKSLVEDVRNHLKGNNLPVHPNLSLEMQEWWCREVDRTNCADPVNPGLRDLPALAERFLRTAKAFIFDGGQRVSQEEAERRAAICAKCPMNVSGEFCNTCFLRGMVASTVALVTGWKTSRDAELKTCGVCGCELRVKLMMPVETMDDKALRDQWVEGCWMRPTVAPLAPETPSPEASQ
jgi:hypothetical protein